MSSTEEGDDVSLFCGIVILAPIAMQRFVGETLTDISKRGNGDHPVLVVLIGASSQDDATAIIRQRSTLEFPVEWLEEIRLVDITTALGRVRADEWLPEEWGVGAVRVPPVYLCVDRTAESRADALEFVREMIAGPGDQGG